MADEMNERSDASPRPGAGQVLPWVIAALLGAAALWFATRWVAVDSEKRLLAQREVLATTALRSAEVRLESEQIIGQAIASEYNREKSRSPADAPEVAPLMPTDSALQGAAGAVAWFPSQKDGHLVVQGLPASGQADHYELWLLAPKPTCVAIFSVQAEGRGRVPFTSPEPISDAPRFVVSREANDRTQAANSPTRVLLSSR